MRYVVLLILFVQVLGLRLKAQNYYWIAFSNKANSSYSLSNPEDYLSPRALERRQRQNIEIDSLDLPVSSTYIDSVLTLDVEFVHASKWLNGISVSTNIDNLGDQIKDWDFIKKVHLSKPAVIQKSLTDKFAETEQASLIPIDTSYYGASVHQVGMMEGQFLHNKGFRGEGLQIAVLDAGFLTVDELPAFDSLWQNNRILGFRDFVNPNSDFFNEHYHGMSVLSCMGGNIPGELIGTAPEASYWLLRTEDAGSEYMIEEDNWVVAAEFADSVGVDLINSSLGYSEFEDAATSHTYADMDGKTTRVTRGANIAASRGILVCSSAGNERNDPWMRIIAPSDGDLVMGVGAVNKDLVPALFTSAGPSSDGDIKPNVSAMGYHAAVQKSNGTVGTANGTSFASPVLAGMAACLWQMHPQKTASELKAAIEESGHKYFAPDSLVGYGVPNMRTASAILDPRKGGHSENERLWKVYPNPVDEYVVMEYLGDERGTEFVVEIFTLDGRLLMRKNEMATSRTVVHNLPLKSGMFLLRISNSESSHTFKLSKISW